MKILHRIVTPIAALLVFPAAYFLPFFRVMISVGSLGNAETKTNLMDTLGVGEYLSIGELIEIIKSGALNNVSAFKPIIDAILNANDKKITDMIPGIPWAVAFLVFFAFVLIIALALAVVAAVSKKPKASIWLSVGGIVSALLMNMCFTNFAKPFVTGTLNSILGLDNAIISIASKLVSIDYMALSVVYTAILVIFIVTFITSASAYFEEKR